MALGRGKEDVGRAWVVVGAARGKGRTVWFEDEVTVRWAEGRGPLGCLEGVGERSGEGEEGPSNVCGMGAEAAGPATTVGEGEGAGATKGSSRAAGDTLEGEVCADACVLETSRDGLAGGPNRLLGRANGLLGRSRFVPPS